MTQEALKVCCGAKGIADDKLLGAFEAHRERIETAMIKAQPSLAPVLKKLKAPRKKPDEARQRRKSDPKRG